MIFGFAVLLVLVSALAGLTFYGEHVMRKIIARVCKDHSIELPDKALDYMMVTSGFMLFFVGIYFLSCKVFFTEDFIMESLSRQTSDSILGWVGSAKSMCRPPITPPSPPDGSLNDSDDSDDSDEE